MEQIQIDNKLFVKLPEGAHNFAFGKDDPNTLYYYLKDYHNSFDHRGISLPPGNWQIVGETKSITEEQALKLGLHHQMMPTGIPGTNEWREEIRWHNYIDGRLNLFLPKDCLHSWMQANKIDARENYLAMIRV